MSMRKFFFEFNKFSLRTKLVYYVINLSESFLVAIIVSRIFVMDFNNTILTIIIGLIMTPLGINFVGGYKNIKEKFMRRHKLTNEDFI